MPRPGVGNLFPTPAASALLLRGLGRGRRLTACQIAGARCHGSACRQRPHRLQCDPARARALRLGYRVRPLRYISWLKKVAPWSRPGRMLSARTRRPGRLDGGASDRSSTRSGGAGRSGRGPGETSRPVRRLAGPLGALRRSHVRVRSRWRGQGHSGSSPDRAPSAARTAIDGSTAVRSALAGHRRRAPNTGLGRDPVSAQNPPQRQVTR